MYRRGTPPDATYTFKHALVQDAAYDSLLKSKRTQLHAQIAQVLEKDFADRVANEPELLAHHYTQAGNLTQAIPLWREAGSWRREEWPSRRRLAISKKGLALIEQLPPSSERDELELSIREPLNGAWIGLRGWAAPEVGDNAAAILQLAKSQGDSREPADRDCGGYGSTPSPRAASRSRSSGLSACWPKATKPGTSICRSSDIRAAMISHFYLGQLLEAREHGNRGARAVRSAARRARGCSSRVMTSRTVCRCLVGSVDLDAGLPGPGRADER